MVGQKLGQYRLMERLARGGMGTVYLAIDETLDREVAIKILDADVDDPERFRTEATIIARLNHPGIATVHELIQGQPCAMVMELVRGETFEQLLDRLGHLTPEHSADLCMQALSALAYSHRMGVIHRDLKPSNLMISTSGAVKIMDFGVARVIGSAHRTQAGFSMGTPAYMAPEQVKGDPVDARTDLYAMGVIFFRLITGRLPFEGKTPFAVAQSHVNDVPQPVKQLNPDLPEWTEEICTRALAKAPDDRFQTADEFRHVLRRFLNRSDTAISRSNDRTEPLAITPHPAGRRRVAAWSSIAAAVMVIGVAGTRLWWKKSPNPVPPTAARSGQLIASALPISSYGRLLPSLRGRLLTADQSDRESEPSPGVAIERATLASAAAFGHVKMFTLDGDKTNSRDIIVNLSRDQMMLLPSDGGAPLTVLPYRDVQQATYVRARDPRWDPSLSAPAGRVGGVGIFSRPRHWLVVQTKEAYAILQLDGNQSANILQTFENRTGLKITRADGKKTE
jgi:serine/threonine protein kinase